VALALWWSRGDRSRRLAAAVVVLATVVLGLAWGGGDALRGRLFLASIGLGMLVRTGAIPQGPGAFARDFPAAQQAALGDAPELARFESVIDHAHFDALELGYDLGAPALVLLVWIAVAVARVVRIDPSPRRRAAAWTLAIAAGLGLFGYPLFSPSCVPVLSLALALAIASPIPPMPSRLGRGPVVLAVGGGLALQLLAIHQARSELAITTALAAHAQGDDARGLEWARRAVAELPSADALFYLGNFQLAVGDREAALATYRRSYALRPRMQTLANLELARDGAVE